MRMASVMAIESDVFGSCVGEIDVSVGMENRGVWLCCGWNYFVISWEGKAAQDCQLRGEMVPGIGYCFGCFWRVLRNKSPCGGRGGGEIGYL